MTKHKLNAMLPGADSSGSGSEYDPSSSSDESDIEPMSDGASDDGPDGYVPNVSKELHVEQQGAGEIAAVEETIRQVEEQLDDALDLDEDGDSDESEALFDGNVHPPEYFRQGIEMLENDDSRYLRKEYAVSTVKLIDHTERQWRSYCEKILQKRDWRKCLRNITFPALYHFLRWHLAQKTGKDGRRKRKLQSKQSLVTFWCNFRLAVERELHIKVDRLLDLRKVHNALAELGKPLNHNVRPNRSMTLEDLKLQLGTTLRTTEKTFKVGELRLLAALFLLLLAPAGSRPASILKMRFRDLKVLLVRDPDDPDGHPRLIIKLTLAFTKEYLGLKPTKSFVIPEILHDPSLLLSPHVFLLGILIKHRAFKSDILNDDPHVLSTTRIVPGENEIHLGLRPDVMDRYVFRRAEKGIMGFYMDPEMRSKPITRAMMGKWISAVGKLSGFEHNTIAYSLRYMAGNSLDRDVNISDSLRNMVLDHSHGSDTFQNHYLNRSIGADIWAIHRGLKPQQALVQQAISHGHSVSSRRPVELSEAQVAALKDTPKYKRLTLQLLEAPHRSDKRYRISLRRKALLERLRKAKLEEIRAEWSLHQGVEDVERQHRGEEVASRPYARASRPLCPSQQAMIDALTSPLGKDIEGEHRRRTRAINAVVAFCDEEEPEATRSKVVPKPSPPAELEQKATPQEQMLTIKNSTLVSVVGSEVRRCYLCVAKAETLGREHPRFSTLCHEFARHGNLARHFITIHLDAVAPNSTSECPICQKTLISKQHLQNHTLRIHGIHTGIVFNRRGKRR